MLSKSAYAEYVYLTYYLLSSKNTNEIHSRNTNLQREGKHRANDESHSLSHPFFAYIDCG